MTNPDTQQFETIDSENMFSFKWTLENYGMIGFNRKLQSPEFQTKDEKIWQVTFEKRYSSPVFYFILGFYTSEMDNVNFEIIVKFQNTTGIISITLPAERIESEKGILFSVDYTKFPSDSNYGKLKNVVLLCIMIFDKKLTPRGSNSSFDTLSASLKKLFESSVGSDVTFKIHGSTILAHKSILIVRSPVFERMFQAPMVESSTSEVKIDDIEHEVFKMFLEYLYTGVCPDCDLVTARALVYAADKYSVLELKQLIFKQQQSKISVDNAVSLLALADLHGDEDTKTCVSKFIKPYTDKIPDLKAVWKIFEDGFSDKPRTELLKSICFCDSQKRNS